MQSVKYFIAGLVLSGCTFLFFGFETGKQPISAIDSELGEPVSAAAESRR